MREMMMWVAKKRADEPEVALDAAEEIFEDALPCSADNWESLLKQCTQDCNEEGAAQERLLHVVFRWGFVIGAAYTLTGIMDGHIEVGRK